MPTCPRVAPRLDATCERSGRSGPDRHHARAAAQRIRHAHVLPRPQTSRPHPASGRRRTTVPWHVPTVRGLRQRPVDRRGAHRLPALYRQHLFAELARRLLHAVGQQWLFVEQGPVDRDRRVCRFWHSSGRKLIHDLPHEYPYRGARGPRTGRGVPDTRGTSSAFSCCKPARTRPAVRCPTRSTSNARDSDAPRRGKSPRGAQELEKSPWMATRSLPIASGRLPSRGAVL